MLNTSSSSPNQISDDREARLEALLQLLRPDAELTIRRMAEKLVDLPQEQAFGQIEFILRDLGRDLAAAAHQTGLQAGKKRAT